MASPVDEPHVAGVGRYGGNEGGEEGKKVIDDAIPIRF